MIEGNKVIIISGNYAFGLFDTVHEATTWAFTNIEPRDWKTMCFIPVNPVKEPKCR